MDFKKYSSDTIAELLTYLADNESFSSISGLQDFSKTEVCNIFREIASNLNDHAANQPVMRKESVKQSELTDNVYKVISKLTPQEENLLFKSFKIS